MLFSSTPSLKKTGIRRGMPPSAGASYTTSAPARPNCGRASLMLSIIAANGYWSDPNSLPLSLGASAWADGGAGEGLVTGRADALGDGSADTPGLGEGAAEGAARAGLTLGLATEA